MAESETKRHPEENEADEADEEAVMRSELKSLLTELGVGKGRTISSVDKQSRDILEKNLETARKNMEIELKRREFIRRKNEEEPIEEPRKFPEGYNPSSSRTAGGGKRIMRKEGTIGG